MIEKKLTCAAVRVTVRNRRQDAAGARMAIATSIVAHTMMMTATSVAVYMMMTTARMVVGTTQKMTATRALADMRTSRAMSAAPDMLRMTQTVAADTGMTVKRRVLPRAHLAPNLRRAVRW